MSTAQNLPALEPLRENVPMARVSNIHASIEFYEKLGFRISNREPKNTSIIGWCWLTNGRAHLMLVQAECAITESDNILYYLYATDVHAYREALAARGVKVSEMSYPPYLEKGEFRITDPDGYTLMVGQWETEWFGY